MPASQRGRADRPVRHVDYEVRTQFFAVGGDDTDHMGRPHVGARAGCQSSDRHPSSKLDARRPLGYRGEHSFGHWPPGRQHGIAVVVGTPLAPELFGDGSDDVVAERPSVFEGLGHLW